MRLIDADTLKEEVQDLVDPFVITFIDNAPTVIPDNDIFEWCTDCKEYDQEKHCCHRWSSKIREAAEEVKQYKLDELRPKGEWKLDSVGIYCSECKLHPDYSTDFCPFCGADMRGEKE